MNGENNSKLLSASAQGLSCVAVKLICKVGSATAEALSQCAELTCMGKRLSFQLKCQYKGRLPNSGVPRCSRTSRRRRIARPCACSGRHR